MEISDTAQIAGGPVSRSLEQCKLLVIERKLISNRGHHHTQISALKTLLPDYETHFVAGESYDGFMGPAAGKLDSKSIKLMRLRSRLRYGNMFQRLSALVGTIKSAPAAGLPASAFGDQLIKICRRLQLGPRDLIVVPTAELDAIESAIELSSALRDRAPRICLRFLSPELGERDGKIREKRLRAASAASRPNIFLFCETEEMANYFAVKYGLDVTSGFYLPCSIQPVPLRRDVTLQSERFRVGVFGEPRPEKGSTRIPGIIESVALLAKSRPTRPLEFMIQGSPADFGQGGIYDALQKSFTATHDVIVSPQMNRLSPLEFEHFFEAVDAVLVPYERSVYRLQGSGVIQDAVAAHKPIVHIEGMSMAAFLSHGNACAATTDMEFAEAILHISEEPWKFRAGTARAAAYFDNLMRNSPFMSIVAKG